MSTICHKCRKSKDDCSCPRARRRNPSLRRWYRTARWARLRQYVGQRDFWMCQACLKAGREESGNEIDHILRASIKQDLFWDASNLQTLCKSCHSKKTKAEGVLQ